MELTSFVDAIVKGHATIRIFEDDVCVDEIEADNILCTAGLLTLVQCINWSGVTDQNGNMGNAFSAASLAPVYGAIGNGQGTTFTLAASLTNGSNFAQITANVAQTLAAGTTIVIGAGAATFIAVTVSSNVVASTTIPVTTFTANANYTVGTTCAYVTVGDVALYAEQLRTVVTAATYTAATGVASWTWLFFFGTTGSNITITEAGVFVQAASTSGSGAMLDHLLISPSVTKLTSQTATLQITFTIGN